MSFNSRPGASRMAGALCAALSLALPFPAYAHAFGVRYDLPLPLDLYIAGAGGAVAFSFAIMAVAFRARPRDASEPWIDLSAFAAWRALTGPICRRILAAASLALFALIMIAGFFGTQEASKNIAPALVWILWWIALAYFAALIGDIWPAINPWSAAFSAVERLSQRPGGMGRFDLGLPYPAWLGAWPAVLFLVCFAWFELLSEVAHQPATLAKAAAAYSIVTWLGMAMFGRSVWLANAEAFTLAFGVFGRFAPFGRLVPSGERTGGGPIYLRSYAAALSLPDRARLSTTAFVLTMLSTVSFDGFKETPAWGDLLSAIVSARALYPMLIGLHNLGVNYQILLETALLALFPAVFLAVYLSVCRLTKRLAGSALSTVEIGGLFVYSLAPIAIAYHLAHYMSYLLVSGQLIIPLSSDPFGIGWNLFGTADYKVDISVVGAEFVWYVAVVAIVLGHVIAVGVAHMVALRVFETAKAALRSQYPMLVLMVGYTMTSLWVLSQPIVGGGDVYLLSSPSGRVTLGPVRFREICYDLAAGEALEHSFSSDLPVDFDIHYHDGFSIRRPAQSDGVTELSGRFVAPLDRTYCLFWLNRKLSDATLRYRVIRP